MRFAFKVILSLFGLISVSTAIAGSGDRLSIKLPLMAEEPSMATEWVAKKMAMNGLPMSIKTFRSDRSQSDIFRFYRSKWRSFGLGEVKQYKQNGYDVIGFNHDGYYRSVQVKQLSRGVEGSLIISVEPNLLEADTSTDFPLPLRHRVVSKIDSLDGMVRAETLTVELWKSSALAESYFLSALKREGWTHLDIGKQRDFKGNAVLNFQRGKEQSTLAIQPSPVGFGQSIVVINWIK